MTAGLACPSVPTVVAGLHSHPYPRDASTVHRRGFVAWQALLFFNFAPSGVQDIRMQYGHCAVVAGSKLTGAFCMPAVCCQYCHLG